MEEEKEDRRMPKSWRVEELQPGVDWGRRYSLTNFKEISPDHKSVMFQLLHQLLPPGERVYTAQTPAGQEPCLQPLQD